MDTGLTVSVDGRLLDISDGRVYGISRYAQGLLGVLPEVARERGGELIVLRERDLRRPPLPRRAVELVEQALLPLNLLRSGSSVHHSLSPYGTPLVSRPWWSSPSMTWRRSSGPPSTCRPGWCTGCSTARRAARRR